MINMIYILMILFVIVFFYPMCRKTSCFSYGDIRHVF